MQYKYIYKALPLQFVGFSSQVWDECDPSLAWMCSGRWCGGRYYSGCLTVAVAPLFLGWPSKAHSFLHTSTMLCAQTKDGSWWWPLSESHNTEHTSTSPMTQALPIIHLCTAHLLIYLPTTEHCTGTCSFTRYWKGSLSTSTLWKQMVENLHLTFLI